MGSEASWAAAHPRPAAQTRGATTGPPSRAALGVHGNEAHARPGFRLDGAYTLVSVQHLPTSGRKWHGSGLIESSRLWPGLMPFLADFGRALRHRRFASPPQPLDRKRMTLVTGKGGHEDYANIWKAA